MISFVKVAVTVCKVIPRALIFKETVYAVHTTALHRTLDHKIAVLLEIAIAVISEILVISHTEDDTAISVGCTLH